MRVRKSKYNPLTSHLLLAKDRTLTMTFEELEQVLGFALPKSATEHQAWWDGASQHTQAYSWSNAGFTAKPILKERKVVFTKYEVSPYKNAWQRKYVWIEAENYAEWDIDDTNSDVIVTFPDRSKYFACFFTYLNIQKLIKKYERTGECLQGAYFAEPHMILIDHLTRESVEEVINHMLEKQEFENYFNRTTDVEVEEENLYPKGFFVERVEV